MARRMRKKFSKNKQLTISVEDIAIIRKENTIQAIQITNLFPLLVLKDKFRFGQKRLKRFQSQYAEAWEQHNDGTLEISKIVRSYEKKYHLKEVTITDTKHKYPYEPLNKKIPLRKRDIDTIRSRSLSDAVHITLYIPLYVLATHWGFGEKRLKQFITYYQDLWVAYQNNYLTLADIEDVLAEENNVTWD